MRIAAPGGVGARRLPMPVGAGHEVHGLHRRPRQARELQRAAAIPRAGDPMEMRVADVAALVRGAGAVVSLAGADGAGTAQATRIDGDGPGTLARAMEA